MRIVHLCNMPLPPGHPDYHRLVVHPGRWVLNLAQAQRQHAGIDARLVMQVPGASADYSTEIEGVPAHFVAAPDRFRSAMLFIPDVFRLRRAVLAQGPDLVHAHGTEDAYALAAQTCKMPYVITAQGCFFILNREMPPRLFSREKAVQFTEWVALKHARHIIAKSTYVRDELKAAFPHLTMHEIPNTFDPRLLEIPIDGGRQPGSLAFVGTLVPRKGVDYIVQALELLKVQSPEAFDGLTFHVFGNRPEPSAYEAECKRRLFGLMGDRVVFHGTISALQVAEALSRLEVLLAPSLEEMFGNQFIEAIVSGSDAIVTGGTALAENARRLGAGRIIPRRDSGALAEAIHSALTMSLELGERMARRNRVMDFMGPETVSQRHRELYEKLVARF